jgi:hypothetical protein
MTGYDSFIEVCQEQPWLREAYQKKRITDDGFKELIFYLADQKGKDVSLFLPIMRELLLEHVRLFLLADKSNMVNRLTVTKQIRTPGFMLERELYRHCVDIEAYVRTKKERFRLTLLRIYGPQKNELYQSAWRSDFARSFAAADYKHCRTLLFLFVFRKLSYVQGIHYQVLRQYEDRLLACASAYGLDLAFLQKNFAMEYAHVARKIVAASVHAEQQAKANIRMVDRQ